MKNSMKVTIDSVNHTVSFDLNVAGQEGNKYVIANERGEVKEFNEADLPEDEIGCVMANLNSIWSSLGIDLSANFHAQFLAIMANNIMYNKGLKL